jgi:feruloyl esterase
MNVSTVALADSINPGGCNAYNPDLRPFQDAGGKLIQYHGYADYLIPAYNAPAWYDKLVGFYSDIGRGGQVEDWYRLFTVPGMGHCSGGEGPWVIDGASQGGIVPETDDQGHSMLWSLVEWVEGVNGTAPEAVIGTKYVNDTESSGVDFERPVCRWPGVAQYVGGKVSTASSWVCPEAVY